MPRCFHLVVLVAASLIVGCGADQSTRLSVAESKSYEASLFRQNCTICHGPEAEGRVLDDGRAVPNLRTPPHKYTTRAEIRNHISEGGNGMVPFRDQLTDREIDMLVDFVLNGLRK